MGLRVLPAVLAVILAGGFAAGLVLMRARLGRIPYVRAVTVGIIAAAAVFVVQSDSVGASIGGGILALAAGAVAVLVVALLRNV